MAPVDSQAIPQVKNLLCFLYSVYGKKVISGQQETSWVANPNQDAQQIQRVTGKTPALRGGDFMYQQTEQGGTTTDRALAQWKTGGISQLIYHMGNPTGDDSYASAKTSCGAGCIAASITAGSAKNGVLISRLNHAVTELLKLQAANVAVIWRPWHESNGGWFWWGMEGGAQFVALYKYEFQYFMSKGVHNVVWEVSWASGNPNSTWNPGASFFDVAGQDYVTTDTAMRALVGNTIPISNQENGPLPNVATMFNPGSQSIFLFWNTWAGFESQTPNAQTIASYTDPHTINLGDVPNLN